MGIFFGSFGSHAHKHFDGSDNLDGAYFYDTITFPSITGFTTTIDPTGSITPKGNSVDLVTDTGLNDDVILCPSNPYIIGTGQEMWCDFGVMQIDVTNTDIYLVVCNPILTSIPVAGTDYYFGFRILNGALWAINSNNVAGTSTDLSTTWGSGAITQALRVHVDAIKVRFYIDGVWAATHTTNHPSVSLGFYPHLVIRTTTTAAKTLKAGRIGVAIKR